MVYKRSILSLPRFGTVFTARTETVLYPYTVLIMNRCASTHFGENQLAPSSIGISPLTITHLTIFKDRRVRTFTWCYPSFILVMVRSPGFGSIRSDRPPKRYIAIVTTCFRLGFGNILNQATSYKSPAHSSTGTRSM